jgi:2-polyprenyl-6-hydroxyphenyl methylase/3-demethylubiquinone-9 3-methyltransferase
MAATNSPHIMNAATNHDPKEIARFDASAQRWWDVQGEFRPLHEINPVRVAYIDKRAALNNKRVLDVGCGGGLAAEGMAKCGAQLTGIDLGANTIEIAELHALESGLKINYRRESAETHASKFAAQYDVVTCLEMLEHVPDPASVIHAVTTLVRPGGDVFFSTINRNLKAYLLAVVGAEYVMKLLTPGTHTYDRFIKPSELARWSRTAGLDAQDVVGIDYNPLTHHCAISDDPSVNYLMHLQRPLST